LLDLFVCLRPVQYFKGVPSPIKHPEKVNMIIFRENTEDIYAGIEYAAGTPEAQKILDFFQKEFPKQFDKIRFGTKQKAADFWKEVGAPEGNDVCVGIGIKPVSRAGSVRLIHSAITYAIKNQRKSVTLVHKGNIMKFTEGAFRDWGYEYANQDKVNPGSVILSGEMMFRYMGWTEAADLILKGLKGAIASKRVTYDFARLMEGATEIKCSEFGSNVIEHM